MESEEFDEAIADLEIRLERLRSLYEQYFLGIERIEPTVARKDVDRRFWRLRKVKVRNTARRFKLQNLVSRYNTLQQHWMKVCRQIENGTYIRHLARAQRRFAPEPVAPKTDASSVATEGDAWQTDDGPTPEQVRRAFSALANAEPTQAAPVPSASSPRRAPAGKGSLASATGARPDDSAQPAPGDAPLPPRRGADPPRAAARPAPHPQRPAPGDARDAPPARAASTVDTGGLSDDAIRRLHQELVRQRAKYEPSSKTVSAPALAQSLRATEAKLKAKHGAKRVEFRIEHKSGRVVIKPTVHR